MATLKINMENGFFSSHNGVYMTEFTPTHVSANGWDCVIREDGSVLCEATRDYSDGIHSMRYEITANGFARLTLKVDGQPVQSLRKGFVLPRGEKLSDGTLGLAGGYIDERYAYFRDGSFQRFLDRFGITAVKHEDPNRLFVVRNARYGGGECNSSLVSDGVVTEIGYDSGRTDSWHDSCPGTCAYEGETSYKVTGASWAIHTQRQDERDCHNYARILYTQVRNVVELERSLMGNAELALYVLKREQAEELDKLEGLKIESTDDIQKVIGQVQRIAPKIKGKINVDEAEEFLRSFDGIQDNGYFFVVVMGPMIHNYSAEYSISIRRGSGKSHWGRELTVAEGFRG